MEVIKNVTRKTEITKELIFTTEIIESELKKKYRMNADTTVAEWTDELVVQDDEGNDINLGRCLVLSGTSVPRKKAAPVVEEPAE